METAELHELVDDLATNIDDLEATLAPLTEKPLTTTSSKLPLLDKAKLHVLATYALESILFNSLRLHGTDAKSHAVFAELNRVKEYFGKIKTAEGTSAKPASRVDKDAAGRFIRAGLAGNERMGRGREEKATREKAGAKRKLEDMSGVGTHTRFDGTMKRIKADEETVKVVTSDDLEEDTDDQSEGGVALTSSGTEKKRKRNKPSDPEKKAEKRARRQKAKEAKLSPHRAPEAQAQDAESGDDGEDGVQLAQVQQKAPKSSAEALDSLLDGATSKLEKKSRRKGKKGKGQQLENERAEEMK